MREKFHHVMKVNARISERAAGCKGIAAPPLQKANVRMFAHWLFSLDLRQFLCIRTRLRDPGVHFHDVMKLLTHWRKL